MSCLPFSQLLWHYRLHLKILVCIYIYICVYAGNTSVDRAAPAAGNLSSNYDHLDNFVPPSSNRRHIQDVDTDQTSPRHGKQVAATDRKQTQEESEIKSDTDGKTECCTIL